QLRSVHRERSIWASDSDATQHLEVVLAVGLRIDDEREYGQPATCGDRLCLTDMRSLVAWGVPLRLPIWISRHNEPNPETVLCLARSGFGHYFPCRRAQCVLRQRRLWQERKHCEEKCK